MFIKKQMPNLIRADTDDPLGKQATPGDVVIAANNDGLVEVDGVLCYCDIDDEALAHLAADVEEEVRRRIDRGETSGAWDDGPVQR